MASGLLDAIEDDETIIYDLENETSGVLAYDEGASSSPPVRYCRQMADGPVNGKMIMIVYLDEECRGIPH